jgi:NADH dehydrogenase
MASDKHTVVIVGGGFAGVRAARQLARQTGLEIVLISDQSNFAYYPQLYHAATGGSRSEASLPLTDLLGGSAVKVIRDTVTALSVEDRTVSGSSGTTYAYDKLILALGSVTNYFGIEGLKEFAFDIKTIEGAEAFKAHLHKELVELHKPELDYVVIGAGPTGVELSAALGQYLHRIVRLHGITSPSYHIDLIEAAPRILPRSSDRYAAKVQARLERLGVRIMTGTAVKAETVDGLQLEGKELKSRTVVWTSGVANNPFFAANATSFELAKNGRVVVNDHMEAAADVYVIGDNASSKYGGLAQTAVGDANFVARDIVRAFGHRKRPAYNQRPAASVIPVGSGWAAAQIGRTAVYGYLGWLIRRVADLIAYHDIEATSTALRVWLKEPLHEDDCPACRQEQAA